MRLSLKNISKIKEATVEINGITVIAGENNTGKSTVGKVLFSVFNAFYDIGHQIKREKAQSVARIIDNLMFDSPSRTSTRGYILELAEYVVENFENLKEDEDIASIVLSAINQLNEKSDERIEINSLTKNLVNRLSEVLSVTDDEIFKKLLNNRLYDEFNGQINNIYFDEIGEITLIIKHNPVNIKIINDEVKEINAAVDLKTEAVYLDDPFIIDEVRPTPTVLRMRQLYDHRSNIKNKLYRGKQELNAINEIITTNKFDLIFDKVGLTPRGNTLNIRPHFIEINKNNGDKSLSVKNLSTGLKTFLIIKTLLKNGTIQPNGTIILDEPEIHLHPEWQLLFAELIVLIQKEFGMHVLLNTHSPYFLRAIQIYASKHEIADKCKYYLSELVDDDAYINDVSDDVEKIYKKLSLPFQKLDDERWGND